MSVVMTSFSNRFFHYDVINSVIIKEIRLLAKLACYFLRFYIRPNLRSNFCYYKRLERFKMTLRISKGFGSRVGQQKY